MRLNLLILLTVITIPQSTSAHECTCETTQKIKPVIVVPKVTVAETVAEPTENDYEERIRLALAGVHPVTLKCTYIGK